MIGYIRALIQEHQKYKRTIKTMDDKDKFVVDYLRRRTGLSRAEIVKSGAYIGYRDVFIFEGGESDGQREV